MDFGEYPAARKKLGYFAHPGQRSGLATGSYGSIEGRVEANAPLTQSGSLLGRLNVLYRDSDDFVKDSAENRIYVAPPDAGYFTRVTPGEPRNRRFAVSRKF
jgi:hypothetical protein